MKSWQRGNTTSRLYDAAISSPGLEKVVERRHSPDGLQHPIKTIRRGSKATLQYPWDKLELGDFFVAPIGDRSEKAMRVAFYQLAARRDWEIAVTPILSLSGGESLRVCLVLMNLSKVKAKARLMGVEGLDSVSDGKWRSRRRKWEKDRRAQLSASSAPKPAPPPSSRSSDDPFWADNDPALPAPESVAQPLPETLLILDPVEKRRQALIRAGVNPDGDL